MDQVLQGLEDFSAAYLDDVVIYSETWEEHLEHVRRVLQRNVSLVCPIVCI